MQSLSSLFSLKSPVPGRNRRKERPAEKQLLVATMIQCSTRWLQVGKGRSDAIERASSMWWIRHDCVHWLPCVAGAKKTPSPSRPGVEYLASIRQNQSTNVYSKCVKLVIVGTRSVSLVAWCRRGWANSVWAIDGLCATSRDRVVGKEGGEGKPLSNNKCRILNRVEHYFIHRQLILYSIIFMKLNKQTNNRRRRRKALHVSLDIAENTR